MKFALVDGNRAEATRGASAVCPICGVPVVAKMGDIVVHHWAHSANASCSDDHEAETEWHRGWKSCAPDCIQEVVAVHEGERRRGDVVGLTQVVELQSAAPKTGVLEGREQFWAALGKTVVWMVNGRDAVADGRLVFQQSARTVRSVSLAWARPPTWFVSAGADVLIDTGEGIVHTGPAARAAWRKGGPGWLAGTRFSTDEIAEWLAHGMPPLRLFALTPRPEWAIMPFGKYRGRSFADLMAEDPEYLEWAVKEADGIKKNTNLLIHAAWALSRGRSATPLDSPPPAL